MDKKMDFSMQDAIRLAQTPAGKQLISILQQQDNPELQNAMQNAASGDYGKAKDALSSLLANPDVQALLKQLGGNHG